MRDFPVTRVTENTSERKQRSRSLDNNHSLAINIEVFPHIPCSNISGTRPPPPHHSSSSCRQDQLYYTTEQECDVISKPKCMVLPIPGNTIRNQSFSRNLISRMFIPTLLFPTVRCYQVVFNFLLDVEYANLSCARTYE